MELRDTEFCTFEPNNLPDPGVYWFVIDKLVIEPETEDQLGTVGGFITGEIERQMILSDLEVRVDNSFVLTSVNEDIFGIISKDDNVVAYAPFLAPKAPNHLLIGDKKRAA